MRETDGLPLPPGVALLSLAGVEDPSVEDMWFDDDGMMWAVHVDDDGTAYTRTTGAMVPPPSYMTMLAALRAILDTDCSVPLERGGKRWCCELRQIAWQALGAPDFAHPLAGARTALVNLNKSDE